jgi:hypothetical protein
MSSKGRFFRETLKFVDQFRLKSVEVSRQQIPSDGLRNPATNDT